MPELPEVEVVRAGLAPAVTGAVVESVTVYDERSLRRHDGPSDDFVQRLTGAVLGAPFRRGKFLWIPIGESPTLDPAGSRAGAAGPSAGAAGPSAGPPGSVDAVRMQLSPEILADGGRNSGKLGPDDGESPELAARRGANSASASRAGGAESAPVRPTGPAVHDEAVVVHLGMSGQVLLRDQGTDDNLTRVRLELRHPEHGPLRLNFVDQRIFGSMAIDPLLPTEVPGESVPSQVAHIARDPLDPHFDDAAFFAKLAKRNTGIKRALLDQGLISGIGNIYADESLWLSRLHYEYPTAQLPTARAKALLAEVRAVLRKALDEGGTSFDAQYVNVNGQSGYFSHSLNAYGQQGNPCPRCSRPIVREQFMNRGSHFCPWCQRMPKRSL
jgi:formamidopyrimidine-DNA glycosylase